MYDRADGRHENHFFSHFVCVRLEGSEGDGNSSRKSLRLRSPTGVMRRE